jgi:hypothetical protein
MKKIYKNLIKLFIAALVLLPVTMFAQSNQYLHFDKVDDFAILDGAGQYVDGATELSITGWFYCDELSYGQGYMGFRAGSGSGEFYLIQLNNGVMECRLLTTTGLHEYVTPANTAIPQLWQHIAWIFTGSEIKLYVNGFFVGGSSASGVFSSSTVPFGIGKSLLGGFNFVFGGRIDEVTVWDKALSQSEIEDMMDNELTGNEDNLQLYYKFNQGEPGGNNTAITHLISEIGDGERDAELMNFALEGETSNFNGELNTGYQAISFPQIPHKLTTDEPFEIEASATSGLDVLFEIISGPATVDGNVITLTGAGEVVVEATQPGDDEWDPADPVQNSFMVLDPMLHVPEIDARSPLAGDVYVPTLGPVQLATIATIEYPELFNVQNVSFEIDGVTYTPINFENGHYFTWWTPPAHGSYTVIINASNNFGAVATETVSINVTATVPDVEVLAFEGLWCNTSTPEIIVDAELPSYMGAFDEIIANMYVTCPPGGCGEWDRVASIDAKGHDGEWFEIIRYITPYSTACSHIIDLTDYMSLLQGKVSFRINSPTLDNGYEYNMEISFNAGSPQFPYSKVNNIWWETYDFGNYDNMQPVDDAYFSFPEEAVASKLKLVSTGHGWGDLNTGNAAEFYEATHTIWINGAQTYEQYNWWTCNPNPDGCQPQNGTWYFNRAGWCPGAIAQWFDYDLTSYMGSGDIDLGYLFYPDYVDYCHPNHPDCVTGVTCDDCDAGFNPHLVVACNLVTFANNPLVVGIKEPVNNFYTTLLPNPAHGQVELSVFGPSSADTKTIEIFDVNGKSLRQFDTHEKKVSISTDEYKAGMYIVNITVNGKTEIKKLMVQ